MMIDGNNASGGRRGAGSRLEFSAPFRRQAINTKLVGKTAAITPAPFALGERASRIAQTPEEALLLDQATVAGRRMQAQAGLQQAIETANPG